MRGDWLFRLVFASLLVAAGALAIAYRYLPLQDWPQHLALGSITSHFHDSTLGYSRYYVATGWFRPYHGFRLLQRMLGALLGDSLGFRTALLVPLWGIPLGILLVVRRLGVDHWIGIGSFCLLVEGNFLWGYAPYLLGLTLLYFALHATLVYLETAQRDGRWLVWLALLGAATFFTHPQACANLLLSCSLVALVQRTSWRSRAAVLMACAPAAVLLAIWLAVGGLGQTSTGAAAIWPSWSERVRSLGEDSGLTLLSVVPAYAYLLVVTTLVVTFRLSRSAGVLSRSSFSLLVLWGAMALFLPSWWRGESFAGRCVSQAGIALLWVLSSTARARWALAAVRVVLVCAALLAIAASHRHFARYQEELAGFDRLLPQIPLGSRVAVLAYGTPDAVKLPDAVHLGGYIQAARGGFNALTTTQGAVTYAPSVDEGCKLEPVQFKPAALGWMLPEWRASCFDVLVVVKGPRYSGSPVVATARAAFERKVTDGDFELWVRR